MLSRKNYFFTIEGIEGAGKSTALTYISQYLSQAGISHITTREPGGTPLAETIRQCLLYPQTCETMSADTELLLMFASRAQHLSRCILPALQRGDWVISDRFTDATYAYQGGGRGISANRITQLENWVQGDLRPDHVFLLDIPVALSLQRIQNRTNTDRIESEKIAFFDQVRQTYLARSQNNPQHYTCINAALPLASVQQCIKTVLTRFIDS